MLFVTGITGHSGRWFVQRLQKENFQGKIRCLVRSGSDTAFFDNCGLNIEKVVGDLTDLDFLRNSLNGVSTVLHIASIKYSPNVVAAAIENNVEWCILVHTTGRFSKFKSAAAEYIEIEEKILRLRDKIGVTVLRPTMIYGSSRDRNMYKLVDYLSRHKFFPMFGSGQNLMQPVHARDLGDAYYQVLINRKKTFNKEYDLPGKEPLAYIDIVRIVSKALNRKNVIVKFPIWFSLGAAKIYNAIDSKAIIAVEQVLRMQEDKAFQYEDAIRDFNYAPVSFDEGILEEVNEFLSKVREH